MVTLDELLQIAEADEYTVIARMTPRLKARLTVNAGDMAALDDLSRLYGAQRVRRFTPTFHGDARMVIEIDNGMGWDDVEPVE